MSNYPGRTTAIGMGSPHQKRRALLAPIVAAGQTRCARCHELIRPGEPWDLGHVDGTDRHAQVYSGPEHRRCNRAAGGRQSGGRVQWRPGPPEPEPERDGLEPDDERWGVPWLTALRKVPADAVWPRLMTVPHPRAVGSLGDEFVGWLRSGAGCRCAGGRGWLLLGCSRSTSDGRAGLGDGGLDDGPPARQVVAAPGVVACGGSTRANGSGSRRT